MSGIKQHIVARAIRKATQSPCKMRVAAIGFNRSGIPIMTRTNKPTQFGKRGGGKHAERQIMAEASRKGITYIVICRIGGGGDLRPIDPCPTCQSIADKLGIKIYTVPGSYDETN